jgi:sugar phosphate isomerase/epimerase
VHRQLSVSAVSSWRWPFDDDLRFWERSGIERVGLSLRKCEEIGLDAAVSRVRDAGLDVSDLVECGWCEPALPATWAGYRDRMLAAVDACARLGGAVLVLTTGPAGDLDWSAAAERLATALDPVLGEAEARGVPVAIENTGSLRVDLSFVTTFRDACDLAARLGCGVCMETSACWAERALAGSLLRHASRLRHVQLSDAFVASRCTPDRGVPGDGDVPLDRVVSNVAATGYAGAYELELVGPRIEDEGYERAVVRAVAAATLLLDRYGSSSPNSG